MSGSIYVITNYQKVKCLDERFLNSEKNFIYYLIDKNIPDILKDKKCLIEYDIDPLLYKAGKDHLAEWSFLLNEAKHSFCQYPFFMISSRFYDKNNWLLHNLGYYWKNLFELLNKYNFGFLPSYDRPLRWVSYADWGKKIERKEWELRFFPFTKYTSSLIKETLGLDIVKEVGYSSDLFCNYIGFNNRQDLLKYVNFYIPLINYLFNEKYQLKKDLNKYIKPSIFPKAPQNEKSFVYILEAASHLYFFKKKEKSFALHYDGFYEIDERKKKMKKLIKFQLPLQLRIKRFFQWQRTKFFTEGSYPFYKRDIKKIIFRKK